MSHADEEDSSPSSPGELVHVENKRERNDDGGILSSPSNVLSFMFGMVGTAVAAVTLSSLRLSEPIEKSEKTKKHLPNSRVGRDVYEGVVRNLGGSLSQKPSSPEPSDEPEYHVVKYDDIEHDEDIDDDEESGSNRRRLKTPADGFRVLYYKRYSP
jgi:hypothetical protein